MNDIVNYFGTLPKGDLALWVGLLALLLLELGIHKKATRKRPLI